jgi:photosystem II stability/assembly factor-like uncharacterized protein
MAKTKPLPLHPVLVGASWLALSMSSHGCVIPISSTASSDSGVTSLPPTGDGGAGGSGDATSEPTELPDSAPPKGSWVNVTANLANIPSVCGTLTAVSAKPDEDLLIAGVAGVGIYGSRDGGNSWQELSGQTDGGTIINRLTVPVYDPSNSKRFWEVGIYGASPFITNDDGATWSQVGTINATDFLSVDFSDPARQTLLAGGHEQAQTLYRSTNGGATWNNIGSSLPGSTNCTLPIIVDSQTYLVGCGGYGGGPSGVYRSTDAGNTWQKMTASGGAAAPLVASDGAIYWISANNAGMTRSLDKGKTWTDVVGPGVITTDALDRPVEIGLGTIAIMGMTYILSSSDQGATWKPATAALPIATNEDIHGVAY